MEMFDVRTPQGDPTGEVKERSAVHRDGDWHGTAHIWLVRRREGRIELLLQKRSRTKESFPGCYDTSCAGHLSAGDTFLEAALRELEEELGIAASGEELYFAGIYPCQVDDYFYEKPVNEADLRLQAEEVEAVCWIDFERLKELAAAGAEGYCIFPWETSALESAFQRRYGI